MESQAVAAAAIQAVAAVVSETEVAAEEEAAAAGWEGVASLQGSVRRELGGGCEL